jgi:hypothetical protein
VAALDSGTRTNVTALDSGARADVAALNCIAYQVCCGERGKQLATLKGLDLGSVTSQGAAARVDILMAES